MPWLQPFCASLYNHFVCVLCFNTWNINDSKQNSRWINSGWYNKTDNPRNDLNIWILPSGQNKCWQMFLQTTDTLKRWNCPCCCRPCCELEKKNNISLPNVNLKAKKFFFFSCFFFFGSVLKTSLFSNPMNFLLAEI